MAPPTVTITYDEAKLDGTRRAPKGTWRPFAEAVAEMVAGGKMGVSEAVRDVLAKSGISERAGFEGVRGYYYVLRRGAAGKRKEPT